MSLHTPTKNDATCAWCSRPIQSSGRGRPRKYCSHSCRQRAYEQRNNVAGTQIPVDAVILSPEKVTALVDQLFELRCLAEDIETAVDEQATKEELSMMTADLVSLSRKIEQLRISH